ncbi:MAG TPA: hypothetical protein VLU43_18405, partial [Anaeromyxobacteraceae bacterium]|nr:hypothetical protein [Anaeromyxobacteraceae bacterium]
MKRGKPRANQAARPSVTTAVRSLAGAVASLALLGLGAPAGAHVTLDPAPARADAYYKAVL